MTKTNVTFSAIISVYYNITTLMDKTLSNINEQRSSFVQICFSK